MNESFKTGQTQIKQHKRMHHEVIVTKTRHNDGNMISATIDSHWSNFFQSYTDTIAFKQSLTRVEHSV